MAMMMQHSDFNKFELNHAILKNLSSLSYHKTTPIQEMSLESILGGQDVLAQAKTGTGKTAAFGLGLLNHIDIKNKSPQALIICPTRELADQVANEIRKLGRMIPNLKVLNLVGGTPLAPQAASLRFGAHCIVGTPGRIKDHMSRRSIYLRSLKTVVLDEADRLLEMGFIDEIDKILRQCPKDKQTLFFSATYPDQIMSLSKRYQRNPVQIKADSGLHISSKIDQHFYLAKDMSKDEAMISILSQYQPERSIVFCNTKIQCKQLCAKLSQSGFAAKTIHGDLEQSERSEVLAQFASNSISVLIATDVGARGLDISGLDAVFNYDLARDPQVHTHRIGRTGRADQSGLAFNIIDSENCPSLEKIAEYNNLEMQSIKVKKPSKSNIKIFTPPMTTLKIFGGKKSKLRPTDILGTLTATKELKSDDIGKINILPFNSYVAISRGKVKHASNILEHRRMKGRFYKSTILN